MPRPSNMVFAQDERKKASSFATTPLYTMAVARYNIGSSHSIKVDLLQFCFKWFTSYKIRPPHMRRLHVESNQVQGKHLSFFGTDENRLDLHRLRPRVRGSQQHKHTLEGLINSNGYTRIGMAILGD